MSPQSRRRLSALVRWAVCIAAVTWLVTQSKWSEFKRVLDSADWRLAVLAVLAFGPAPVIIAIRLKVLLHVHHIHLTVWQAIKVTFAGNFIINALPVGTSGGDAVKAYYVARDTPHKHEAVTCVFFDRVIGVVGLVGLSGVILIINWDNPAFAGLGQTIAVLVALMMIGAGTYFSTRMRRLLRLEKIVARLPLGTHLQRIDAAAFAFRHRVGRLMACLALSTALQVTAVFSMFLAGWALGMVAEHPWSSLPVYLAYTPICYLAGALPIGVMEQFFKEFFVDAAGLGTREAAYSLSLLGRLIQLTWALPGLLVVLSAGRPRSDDVIDVAPTTPETKIES